MRAYETNRERAYNFFPSCKLLPELVKSLSVELGMSTAVDDLFGALLESFHDLQTPL